MVVYEATAAKQTAFLKKPVDVGDAAICTDPENMLYIVCDCEEFMRSGGTICPCALAVASAKFHEGNSHNNLDHLLDKTAATRRPMGRPRKAKPGSCYVSGSDGIVRSTSSGYDKKSAHFYHTTLISSGALRFHKWRVVVDFDGEMCVGTIVSYRKDYHNAEQPYTSKTPFTRLWKCRFDGDHGDKFEEYNAEELAQHLSLAHSQGAHGPDPGVGSDHLTSIPRAAEEMAAGGNGESE